MMVPMEGREQLKYAISIWRDTGLRLERIRREELRRLTPEARRQAINDLLEIGYRFRRPRRISGLVEQQELLSRWRS